MSCGWMHLRERLAGFTAAARKRIRIISNNRQCVYLREYSSTEEAITEDYDDLPVFR